MEQTQTPKGHPKGLYVLFVTEMWERFSYYGMRAIFVLFLTKALLYDKAFGSDIYGSYTGLVYLTPLIGGYMADRYWGNRKSIIIGGIMMAIGQFFMFLAGSFYQNVDLARIIMMGGLTFLIFGNGFFKPNISTMVGQLYPKGDKRVDSAFTIFYMGINLGAFFSPLVCGYLGDTGNPGDFKWGFLAACIGMIVSLILFISLKDKYIVTPEGEAIGSKPNRNRETKDIDTASEVKSEFSTNQIILWLGIEVGLFVLFMLLGQGVIGSFIFSLSITAPGFIISDKSLTKIERSRIWVIYIVAFFVIFFWAAFEQAGAALTF
ncbi:MAG: peptide MFS transporter, partial [Bacteroidota bacterium]